MNWAVLVSNLELFFSTREVQLLGRCGFVFPSAPWDQLLDLRGNRRERVLALTRSKEFGYSSSFF